MRFYGLAMDWLWTWYGPAPNKTDTFHFLAYVSGLQL